ncbi:MAG TPA: hypothetical protein VH394_18455, partial [Thermoanaerobaculia bacterium]|nr:hypothetical protein [Thermoanaerobaculia bacterium]
MPIVVQWTLDEAGVVAGFFGQGTDDPTEKNASRRPEADRSGGGRVPFGCLGSERFEPELVTAVHSTWPDLVLKLCEKAVLHFLGQDMAPS